MSAITMAMVAAAYVLITFWQFRNQCAVVTAHGCYQVRDPLGLALVAAATAGALQMILDEGSGTEVFASPVP